MSQTFYTKDHEYIRVESDVGVVGVSAYAQKALGDIVFVALPQPGAFFARGEETAMVESVKAAADIFAPVSGEVLAVNWALEKAPGLVTEDPEGRGWLFRLRVKDAQELSSLMDADAYCAWLATLD
jgi:glycine cleavage system H protein